MTLFTVRSLYDGKCISACFKRPVVRNRTKHENLIQYACEPIKSMSTEQSLTAVQYICVLNINY